MNKTETGVKISPIWRKNGAKSICMLRSESDDVTELWQLSGQSFKSETVKQTSDFLFQYLVLEKPKINVRERKSNESRETLQNGTKTYFVPPHFSVLRHL